MAENKTSCSICGNFVGFRYKAMPSWNINGHLCGDCYSKKLTEFYIAEDRRNITKK